MISVKSYHQNGRKTVVKRSVKIDGMDTSVSLEDDFWRGLNSVARTNKIKLGDLLSSIDMEREAGGLSSAIRVWLYRRALAGREAR